MNRGVFFAAAVIVIGVLLLIKNLFRLDIPMGRVIIGIVVILVGVSMLTGGWRSRWSADEAGVYTTSGSEDSIVFGSRNFEVKAPGKINVIFGSGVVDLTGTQYNPGEVMEINVIFGDCLVKLGKEKAVNIMSSAAFANVRHPNASGTTWLGEQQTSVGSGTDVMVLKVNCVFGQTIIREVE